MIPFIVGFDILSHTIDEREQIKIVTLPKSAFKNSFFEYFRVDSMHIWQRITNYDTLLHLPQRVCLSVPIDLRIMALFRRLQNFMYIFSEHNFHNFNVSSMPKSTHCELSIGSLSEHSLSARNRIETCRLRQRR